MGGPSEIESESIGPQPITLPLSYSPKMVGNKGIEPNRATTSHAFERKSFTDFRLEYFP